MSIVSYERFDRDGIELVINTGTGESFATQAGYSRMSGLSAQAISKRYNQTINQQKQKTAEIQTVKGLRTVNLITEDMIADWLPEDNPKMASKLLKLGVRMFMHELAGFKVTSTAVSPVEAKVALQPVTDDTIKVHTASIQFFTSNGDLQLAQLVKSRFGNLLLAEQQNLFKPADIEQYEGAVDVAIRLGFKIPPRFEGSLGTDVKKTCAHLIIGKDKRYSMASSKQIGANMYPAGNPEVEQAVLNYCVGKAFHRSDIKFIGE